MGLLGKKLRKTFNRIKMQIEVLERCIERLEQHEKELFEKCVSALTVGDKARAVLYANECAGVRKIIRALVRDKLALERIMVMLESVEDFSDFISTAPAIEAIYMCRHEVGTIVPDVGYELGLIADKLKRILSDILRATGSSLDLGKVVGKAKEILDNVDEEVKRRMKDRWPEIPKVKQVEEK